MIEDPAAAVQADRRFARRYLRVAAPMIASAAVAPSAVAWLLVWAVAGMVYAGAAWARSERQIQRRLDEMEQPGVTTTAVEEKEMAAA